MIISLGKDSEPCGFYPPSSHCYINWISISLSFSSSYGLGGGETFLSVSGIKAKFIFIFYLVISSEFSFAEPPKFLGPAEPNQAAIYSG